MDTMTAIRTYGTRADEDRTDFDDLPRGHFKAAKRTGMTRIVEGTDDLVAPARGNGGGNSRPAIPALTTDHNGETCNNPKCCPQNGPTTGASPAQVNLVKLSLGWLAEYDPIASAAMTDWLDRGGWGTLEGGKGNSASQLITRIKDRLAAAKAAPKPTTPAKTTAWSTWRELAAKLVEIGGQHGARFAVDTEDGAVNELAFWWIVKSTNPETNLTRYFIRQVIGGQGAVRVRMSPEAMISIARKIETAGPVEAMLRYGQEIGSCGHCGRELTNDKSRAFGMGPKCRKDKGM